MDEGNMEAAAALGKGSENENAQEGIELIQSPQKEFRDSEGAFHEFDKDASNSTDGPLLNSLPRCESEVPIEQSTQDGNDIIPVEQSAQNGNAVLVEQSTQGGNDIPAEKSTQDGNAIPAEQSTQDANLLQSSETAVAFGKGSNENAQEGVELIQSPQKECRDSGSTHELNKDASRTTDGPLFNSLPRGESEVSVEQSTQDGNAIPVEQSTHDANATPVEQSTQDGKGFNANGEDEIELIQFPHKECRDSEGAIHEFDKDASKSTDGPLFNALPRCEREVPVEQSTQAGNAVLVELSMQGGNDIPLEQSTQDDNAIPVEQSAQDCNPIQSPEAAAAFGKGSNENVHEGIELTQSPQKEYGESGSIHEFDRNASNSTDDPLLNSLPRSEGEVPAEQSTVDGIAIPVEQSTQDGNVIPVEQLTQDGNAIPAQQSTQGCNHIQSPVDIPTKDGNANPVEQSTQDDNPIQSPVVGQTQDGNANPVEQSTQDGNPIQSPVGVQTQDGNANPVERSTQDCNPIQSQVGVQTQDGNTSPVQQSTQDGNDIPVEQSPQDGNAIPVEQSTQDGNVIPVEQSTQDGNVIPVEQLTQDGNANHVEQSTQDANPIRGPVGVQTQDGNANPVQQSTQYGTAIPVEQSTQDANAIPFEQSTQDANAIPFEQSAQDGNPIQSPVSSGRKMKWKDRARSRLPCPATSPTENSPKWKDRARSRPRSPAVSVTENSPANARTSTRRKKRRARKDLGLQPCSTSTPSVVPTSAVQPSPPSSPPSSPGVLNSSQIQSPDSPGLEIAHTISPPPLQLSRTQATPLSCEQPGEASNSPPWCPVVSDTPTQPVHDVLFNSPPFTSDEVHPVEIEEEFSPSVGSPVAPSKSRGHVASKPPRHPSGKPPRPPQRLAHGLSMTRSRGVKRSLPSNFTSPLAVRQKTQQAPYNREPYASPANEAITDPHDSRFQDLGPPHTYLQSQSIPRSPSDSVSEPLPPSCCPSFLPGPELVPPEIIDFRNGLPQWASGDVPTPEQRKMQHKRSLRQLQTQVKKKLKTWGLKSHLFQEVDEAEADNNNQKLLVINEAQRDAFVKNMVESCRKDPWMRATFLDGVKNLAYAGVLQTSARHLVAQGPCGASEEVIKAWRVMTSQAQDNSSATVNLYKAVDLLHKQGEAAMEKLRPAEDKTLCSLNKRPDGAWEVVTPGPVKRVSRKEK